MKIDLVIGSIFFVVAALIGCALGLGIIGIHYPRVIENEPLQKPHRVMRVEGTNLFLADGRVIAFDSFFREAVTDQLRQADFQVD